MKKILTLLAVFAMFGFISCEEKLEPEPNPTTATITANDVTVEVGKTVSIGATTNSSAAITYACDNSAIATVTASGEVTGVAAGSANITLKVAEVAGKFTAAEKAIKVTVTGADVPPAPQGITVDGDFSDWSELEAGTYAKAESDFNAPWEAVQEIRCYAAGEMVYYYIKFDEESLAEVADWATKEAHLRLCINTDDEFESGYANYFLEAYDFIVEGCFLADGAFIEFDGTLHQRIGSWVSLLEPGNGLVYGVGNGSEYEISFNRTIFNQVANTSTVPMPMGDHFQTGIRFYCNGWDEWSNMPNCDVDEEQGNGWGYLLRVTFKTLDE